MGCMQCFMWYRHFKSVRTFLEDDKRAVQSITVNVEKINQLVPEGCQIDNQQYCWCYWSAVWVHAGNPNVWIEHALSLSSLSLACWQLSRKNIVKVCQDHCQCVADDTSFMLRIISGHDSWVYGYDPETKQQLTQWKSPSSWPKKARQGHSSSKSMLTGFFFGFLTTSIVLCIENSSPRARLSIECSTAAFWCIWERTFVKAAGSMECKELFFTMTIHPVTKLSSLMNF